MTATIESSAEAEEGQRTASLQSSQPLVRRGYLMAIGGAEDKREERLVLRRFVALAGAHAAHIVVMPTASGFMEMVGQKYQELFTNLGAGEVTVLGVNSREEAQDTGAVAVINAATAVFLTGGNQMKISSLLGGTPLLQALRDRYSAGILVGGTSAGASAICQHMIAYGASGSAPKQRMVQLCPGIGLINQVIIDQHFSQRDRVGRLMTAVAHNPYILGLGLDEDTAAIIDPDKRLEVVGRGSVLVIDASNISYSNIHAAKGHGPITMFGVTLNTLTNGYKYDLIERRPILELKIKD